MIRIAICDDIPCMAEVIRDLLIAHDFEVTLEIDCFEQGEELFARSNT